MAAFLSNILEQNLPDDTEAYLRQLLGTTMRRIGDGNRYRIASCGRFRGAITPDLLSFAKNSKLDAALVVVEHDAERILYFNKGELVGSASSVLFERLGRLLYQAEVVSHDDSDTLIDLEEKKGDVALTHALPDTGPAAQALRGEGGIGKTQIAIRYAYEHAGDYDGTWWMDASRPAMDASAAKLATVLGMAPGTQDTPEIIAGAIRERLSSGRHLLILDNLEEPERLVDFLLQPPGRVMITR